MTICYYRTKLLGACVSPADTDSFTYTYNNLASQLLDFNYYYCFNVVLPCCLPLVD